MLEFNQGKRDPMYISESHDSNNILYDIENLENFEKMEKEILNHILY